MKFFGDVEFFLRVGDEYYGGIYFVFVIYYLEGDGFWIFCCYKCLVVFYFVVVEVYWSFEGVVCC